jgi:RHS repeat-associated protein
MNTRVGYLDAESGLHYNRFRTYDPAVGRYISADPIGQLRMLAGNGASRQQSLAYADTEFTRFGEQSYEHILGGWTTDLTWPEGGVNLYEYVIGSPVNRIDPLGLNDWEADLGAWYATSPTGRQLTSIGDAMGGILALALGDPDAAREAFLSATANSGHALLDEMCAPTAAYAAYYGALGTSAAAAATATGLMAVEATTAIRVEVHGTHGGRVLPHLQGIRGPGWGKTIWRFPPH